MKSEYLNVLWSSLMFIWNLEKLGKFPSSFGDHTVFWVLYGTFKLPRKYQKVLTSELERRAEAHPAPWLMHDVKESHLFGVNVSFDYG